MVSNTNRSEYDNIRTAGGLSGSMKLRNPDSPNSISKSRSKSPGSIRKSRSKSPGVGRISSRTWSPGQATLFRRKKIEGEDEVTDTLKGGDDEEIDYLKLSLDAIDKSERSERSERRGRRPQKSKSMDRRELPLGVGSDALIRAGNFLSARLAGKTLDQARASISAEVNSNRAEIDRLTASIVEAGLATPGKDAKDGVLIVRGQSNLLKDVASVIMAHFLGPSQNSRQCQSCHGRLCHLGHHKLII